MPCSVVALRHERRQGRHGNPPSVPCLGRQVSPSPPTRVSFPRSPKAPVMELCVAVVWKQMVAGFGDFAIWACFCARPTPAFAGSDWPSKNAATRFFCLA